MCQLPILLSLALTIARVPFQDEEALLIWAIFQTLEEWLFFVVLFGIFKRLQKEINKNYMEVVYSKSTKNDRK